MIEAAVIVYSRVYGMNITECCSFVGLGAKRVKEILVDFDRYSATLLDGDPDLGYLAKAYGMDYLHLSMGKDTDAVIDAFLKDPERSVLLECDVDPDALA